MIWLFLLLIPAMNLLLLLIFIHIILNLILLTSLVLRLDIDINAVDKKLLNMYNKSKDLNFSFIEITYWDYYTNLSLETLF